MLKQQLTEIKNIDVINQIFSIFNSEQKIFLISNQNVQK
jgi:hypothetical protein